MITASCHCGAVRLEAPAPPDKLIVCNCSLCRRYGALWAFYPAAQVRLEGHPAETQGYVWGERTISTFRCRHCGCITHWEPLAPKPDHKISLNMRNFDPAELGEPRFARFDGAVSWTYLDD